MATSTKEKVPLPDGPNVAHASDGPKPGVTTVVCSTAPQRRPEESYKEKSCVDAYILSVVPIFGLFGSHHFYLGRIWMGCAYCFTVGLFGVGYVVDIFRTPYLVREYNQRIKRGEPPITARRSVTDTYLLWFPCGLFGLHHFYLRNYKLGLLYLCTVGVFGVGWLVDFFRIPNLVQEANDEVPENRDSMPREKSLVVAYLLAFPPLGFLGAHHFYLNRPLWGIIYANTVGAFGLGWIIDLCRMPMLVNRANIARFQSLPAPDGRISTKPENKYVDDVFVLWCPPLGIFGAHHFYLGRIGWGFLYLCTAGCLGIGWIIDVFRLLPLVEAHNEEAEEKRRIKDHLSKTYVSPIQQNGGGSTSVVMTTPLEDGFSGARVPQEVWAEPAFPQNQPPKPLAPGLVPPAYNSDYPTAPPSYFDSMAQNHVYPQLPPK